jgi:DNA-binding response OmpR family regulator
MNVLLVEDDAMLQKSLTYFLKSNKYQVTDFDNGLEATKLKVFELGADEFITKPFSPSVLLRRIEKLISRN